MVSEEVRKAFEQAVKVATARDKLAIMEVVGTLHTLVGDLFAELKDMDVRLSRLERRNDA